jgi:hypothetical protein
MVRVTAPIICAGVVSCSDATFFFKKLRHIFLNHIDSFKNIEVE